MKNFLLIATGVVMMAMSGCGSGPKQAEYQGVSFSHDPAWKITTEEREPGKYLIACIKRDQTEVFLAAFRTDSLLSDTEQLDRYFTGLREQDTYFVREEAHPAVYAGYDCLSAGYTISEQGYNISGTVYAFITGDKCVRLVEQGFRSPDQEKNYDLIANTFCIQ